MLDASFEIAHAGIADADEARGGTAPMPVYFVRVSVMAQVGRFVAESGRTFRRNDRVVCRTARGLEVGEVLGAASFVPSLNVCDGTLLRRTSAEDELLISRLDKNRDDALRACQTYLDQHHSDAILLDVEQLFDTETLYFYFLGEVSAQVAAKVQELAELYESKVQIGSFAAALEHGCGPGCGTDEAAGCGTSCASCDLVKACKSS